MERIKKARGLARSSVTKVITQIETELAKENPDRIKLETHFQLLEKHSEKLSSLDEDLISAMLDGTNTVEECEAENTAIEEYSVRIIEAKFKVNSILHPSPPTPPRSVTSFASAGESIKKTYRLPKIELKKFSGELTEWLGWWAQFQKIDQDDDLHATDKFQYLTQCMVSGTRARDLVERYPQTEENYPKVIAALKDRFGKTKLLKQVYVRELIKMIISKSRDSNGKLSLAHHYDKLESHLRSLESLGVTVDQTVEFLFPMVESSLPEEILIAWQRSSFYGKSNAGEDPTKNELDYLMDFLRQEIDSEEQRALAKAGFGLKASEKKKQSHFDKNSHLDDDMPTAAGLFSAESKKPSCIFCEKSHDSEKCFNAQSMTLEVKKSKIQNKKACFNCFRIGHQSKKCRTAVKCIICGKKHQALLCPEHTTNKSGPPNPETTLVGLNCTSEVILQTLMVRVRNEVSGREKMVRVLLDCGSQRSYILKKTAHDLNFRPVETLTLNHVLFGGSQVAGKSHNMFKINVLGTSDQQYSTAMKVLDQEQICATIPRVQRGPWMSELRGKGIWVSDLNNENPPEIEVLIGADYIGNILTGRSVQLSNGLIATETRLGWTLMGKIQSRNSNLAMSVITMSVVSSTISELWSLESIGIHDPIERKSRLEKELTAKNYFLETVTQSCDGRYSVNLPWSEGMRNLPNNKAVAEKRLVTTTNKLNQCGKYSSYDDVFNAWEEEGIISSVNDSTVNQCHYIPHRAVFKEESKTTPIRPVFDASCKMGRTPSLNNCLEKGPNLLELIPSVLLRFRIGKIGVISDIRKAFLMIEINPEDRDFLRFLWWSDPEKKIIKTFRHNRVVFGMNCSPFLLGAVIEYHLSKVEDQDKAVAAQLWKSLYVDNSVTSVNTRNQYEDFRKKSTQLMAGAKMDLRQWEYSGDGSPEKVASVLGLKWEKSEDSLFCDVIKGEIPEKITKRVILSQVQKIFDPLGFLCPATLIPKLILQKTWSEKSDWDEVISADMSGEFQDWWNDMSGILEKVRVPRNCTAGEELNENYQIHTFSDASKYAYAAIVFLRVESSNGVSVQLLQAKSRVAPLKVATIPRLELLSCTIASRLAASVLEALSIDEKTSYFWSDSTTALAWIKRNDDWGTFVGNRVLEICSLTNPERWRHVPGILNPADLPSRGCSPSKLLESRWWEGPDWLKLDPSEWPSGEGVVDEDLVRQEKKKVTVTTLSYQIHTERPWWLIRSNSYIMNLRIVAWVLRFIHKLRRKVSNSEEELSVDEVSSAELLIFKLIQRDMFPDKTNVISGLRVKRDEDGIIRVLTKIVHRQDTQDFRYPVLLPSTHPMVDLLIRDEHIFNCHGGAQYLIGKLRERCWIIHSRRAIRKILRSCITCRRFSTREPTVPIAPLPEDRVKDAKAFEVTGIDFAGPLMLKSKAKCYIVIFTCAVFRCVHLELAESLSTEDFLLSFVRFSKRKRRPSIVYTDNGTNFVGSVNLFKMIDWKKVEQETRQMRIQWRFNPPAAPWWGGWWERLIRSVKDLLKRMLGFGKYSYVQLETSLCEVESIMNNRPLTYVTEDQDDLVPLTPAMFLHDLPYSYCPEAEVITVDGLRNSRNNMKKLFDDLNARFRKEYLSQLVQRGKDVKNEEFRVGDVVLMGADNKKRISWPMARILELIPGRDGNCRVARVKTAQGEFLRPLQRLYPLEVSSKDEPIPIPPKKNVPNQQIEIIDHQQQNVIAQTRSGRQIKPPARLRY